jgi:hypothetical protein
MFGSGGLLRGYSRHDGGLAGEVLVAPVKRSQDSLSAPDQFQRHAKGIGLPGRQHWLQSLLEYLSTAPKAVALWWQWKPGPRSGIIKGCSS